MKPTLGPYRDLALWLEGECARPLSFLDKQWTDPTAWQTQARRQVTDLLAYAPPALPLDARVEASFEADGLVTEAISWAQPFGPRTQALLVRPAGAIGPLPAVVALHDHSAFYYRGKEKVVATPDEHPSVAALKARSYGGASWATELARRGYVVLAHDLFYWGSRRLRPSDLPGPQAEELAALPPEAPDTLERYHRFLYDYETLVAKSLFLAGCSWPGVMVWEDKRAVDYLLSRREVDAARVACGGLSGGGLRSVFLAALDGRVRAAFCAGFMSTDREILTDKVAGHTWMLHLPGLPRLLDLPDLASLHGPAPLMVLYDRDDPLWTLRGQEDADRRLQATYAKFGAPEAYQGRFYPGGHKFDLPMQADAFAWLDGWLK